jgi:hypothetical protein
MLEHNSAQGAHHLKHSVFPCPLDDSVSRFPNLKFPIEVYPYYYPLLLQNIVG